VILYAPFKDSAVPELILTMVFCSNNIVYWRTYKELQGNIIVLCVVLGNPEGLTWITSFPNKFHSAKFKDESVHPFHDLCVTNNVKYRYV
jgi:hypothetical protein